MNRNILYILVVIVAVVLVGAGYYYFQSQSSTSQPQPSLEPVAEEMLPEAEEAMQEEVTVTLNEVNQSGQSGTAVLKEMEGQTHVSLSLTGGPQEASQPAHIHIGECPGIGAVKYPLENVSNGTSETMVDVALDELMSQLPLAINVHQSPQEINDYTACGDIVAQ